MIGKFLTTVGKIVTVDEGSELEAKAFMVCLDQMYERALAWHSTSSLQDASPTTPPPTAIPPLTSSPSAEEKQTTTNQNHNPRVHNNGGLYTSLNTRYFLEASSPRQRQPARRRLETRRDHVFRWHLTFSHRLEHRYTPIPNLAIQRHDDEERQEILPQGVRGRGEV